MGDGFEFMDACAVECYACGDRVRRALHLCPAESAACVNVCPSCLRTILSEIPDGWIAPGYQPAEGNG